MNHQNIKKLVDRALELACVSDPLLISAVLDNPQWEKHQSRCGDWRNYIDCEVREAWPLLSLESRIVAFIHAETQTDYEMD